MLFVNPEYVVVLYNVNHLKDLLTDKIVEKDYLINYYCKSLKIDYMLKIGSLEYKRLIVQNKVKKIKRKIELINKLEYFQEEEIDDILKSEFEEDSKIEREMFSDINIAIEYSLKESISSEEIENLNVTYSVLVRSWNPLLNKNLEERKKNLYKEAEKAYSDGNIRLLENYINIIEEDEIIQQGEINELLLEEERYKKLLKDVEETIRIIKNSFPYNERDFLMEEKLVRRRKDVINAETHSLEEELKDLEKNLSKLLKDRK